MQTEQTPPLRVRWNEVTWYSKLGAIIVFLGVIPSLSFYIGVQYGQLLNQQELQLCIARTVESNTGIDRVSGVLPDTDYKSAQINIEGQRVTVEKMPEVGQTVPGAGSETHTYFFGDELKTDLNGDGREDVAFIVVQKTGGSGTFYYVVGAVQKPDGSYEGTDGYLLGDRIAPQNINVSQNSRQKNVIVVNYADRAANEPMTAKPSVGKSVYLKLDASSMKWGIVEPNFEGESR